MPATAHPRHGIRAALSEAVRGAVIDQVRTGRPRLAGLPIMIRLLAGVALVVIVIALLWRLFAAALPDEVALVGDAASRGASISMVFVCVHLAAHAVTWRWRIALWVFLVLMHLAAGIGTLTASLFMGSMDFLLLVVVTLLGGIPLLIGTIWGLRRPGSPASVVAVLIGLAVNVGPGLWLGLSTDDPRARFAVNFVFIALFFLPAVALALAGSVSLASLSVNLAHRSVLGFRARRQLRPTVIAWAVVAVAGLLGGIAAMWSARVTTVQLLSSIALVAGGLGCSTLAVMWSRRRRARRPPHLNDLAEQLSKIALPLGVVLGLLSVGAPAITSWLMPGGEPFDLSAPAGTLPEVYLTEAQLHRRSQVFSIGQLVTVPLIGLFSVLSARRGRPVPAMVLAAIAVTFLMSGLAGGEQISDAVVATTLMVVITVVTLVAQRRGRMDEGRWTLVLMGQLLCAIWPWYTTILEPVGLLAGSHALAVLVVGLLWYLATEAGYANRSSARVPRAARLMIFCAHSGALILVALGIDDMVGAFYWQNYNAKLFTNAVPIAAVAALADLARWRVDPDPRLSPS